MEQPNLMTLHTSILRLESRLEEQNRMLNEMHDIFRRKGITLPNESQLRENEIHSAGDISLSMAAELFKCCPRHVSRLAKRFGLTSFKEGKFTRYPLFPILVAIKRHHLTHNESVRVKVDKGNDYEKICLTSLSMSAL